MVPRLRPLQLIAVLVLVPALLVAALLPGASAQEDGKQRFNFRGAGLTRKNDVEQALNNELDAREAAVQLRIVNFESALTPLMRTLPKNRHGKLDSKTVQYALQRFFLDRHGWQIRGLGNIVAPIDNAGDNKKSRKDGGRDNQEEHEDEDWVAGFLQSKFQERVGNQGSDLHSLAALAAALEDLVRHEFTGWMRMVYAAHGTDLAANLSFTEATDRLLTFFVGFLVGGNFSADSYEDLIEKRARFPTVYRDFDDAMDWFDDQVTARFGTEIYRFYGREYSFAEVDAVASDIGDNYYDFNERDCQNLKTTLASLEGRKPGRVRLSTFYNMSRYSHWRFTEKASYLKALGALDDSDPSTPMVIIPNYALAEANCLEASHLYSICCRNDCESLMGSLEQDLQASAAAPSRILELVSDLSSNSIQAPRSLPEGLQGRLQQIAQLHKGEVPIHGRLFAQWMHHAFPLECPYPQEEMPLGTAEAWLATSGERSTQASEREMQELVEKDVCAAEWRGRAECEQEVNDLPWTLQEHLLSMDGLPEVFDFEDLDEQEEEKDKKWEKEKQDVAEKDRDRDRESENIAGLLLQHRYWPVSGSVAQFDKIVAAAAAAGAAIDSFSNDEKRQSREEKEDEDEDAAELAAVPSPSTLLESTLTREPPDIPYMTKPEEEEEEDTEDVAEVARAASGSTTSAVPAAGVSPPMTACLLVALGAAFLLAFACFAKGCPEQLVSFTPLFRCFRQQQTVFVALPLLGLGYCAGLWNSALLAGGCFFALLTLPSSWPLRRRHRLLPPLEGAVPQVKEV